MASHCPHGPQVQEPSEPCCAEQLLSHPGLQLAALITKITANSGNQGIQLLWGGGEGGGYSGVGTAT